MRPGLSEVRTTPHCLVNAFSKDDFPTFDLPISRNKYYKGSTKIPNHLNYLCLTCNELILVHQKFVQPPKRMLHQRGKDENQKSDNLDGKNYL